VSFSVEAPPAIVVACCALAAACALTSCGASARPSRAGSPDGAAGSHSKLAALERKMEELEPSGVRVSFHKAIDVSRVFTRGSRSRTLSTSRGVVEADFEHRVSRLRGVERGERFAAREVHGAFYLSEPWLAQMDGGRPWARVGHIEPRTRLNLGVKLLSAVRPKFALLREVLAAAHSVREDGSATVDGRQAIHYTATFTGPRHAMAVPPHHFSEKSTLQLFVTPAGLPIETVGSVDNGLTATSTTSRLEIVASPVVVRAPRAQLTIGRHEFARIERRRSKGRKPEIFVIKG
jgi:hypothetical protein